MPILPPVFDRLLRASRRLGAVGLPIATVAAVAAISTGCTQTPEPEEDTQPRPKRSIDPSLTFEDVNLEQIDRDGNKRWSILAEQVTYSKDRKMAIAVGLEGKLYSQGEHAYDTKASEGVLSQNGDRIVLTGEIEVTDLKEGTVFSADRVEWLPDDERMAFEGNVSAVNEAGTLTADAGELLEADRLLELEGDVAIEAEESQLKLTAEKGTWQMEEELVIAEGEAIVERSEGEGDDAKVVDRARADKGTLDLGVELITLEGQAELLFGDPPVSMSSELLLWDLPGEVLSSDVPVIIVNRANEVGLSGAQGKYDIASEILVLTGGIEALADENRTRMTAEELTWSVAQETFNAVGNVLYRQAEPEFTLRGPQAEGKLEAQTFIVTGGEVVTEIIPEGDLDL